MKQRTSWIYIHSFDIPSTCTSNSFRIHGAPAAKSPPNWRTVPKAQNPVDCRQFLFPAVHQRICHAGFKSNVLLIVVCSLLSRERLCRERFLFFISPKIWQLTRNVKLGWNVWRPFDSNEVERDWNKPTSIKRRSKKKILKKLNFTRKNTFLAQSISIKCSKQSFVRLLPLSDTKMSLNANNWKQSWFMHIHNLGALQWYPDGCWIAIYTNLRTLHHIMYTHGPR